MPVDEALLAAGDRHGATYFQHLEFLNTIRHADPVEAIVRDGARAVSTGIAAEESIRTGRAVELSRTWRESKMSNSEQFVRSMPALLRLEGIAQAQRAIVRFVVFA